MKKRYIYRDEEYNLGEIYFINWNGNYSYVELVSVDSDGCCRLDEYDYTFDEDGVPLSDDLYPNGRSYYIDLDQFFEMRDAARR